MTEQDFTVIACKKQSTRKLTQKAFLRKMAKKHPTLDFSKSIYVNAKTNVEVICGTHGSFLKTPNALDSQGCPKCGYERVGQLKRKSFSDFISRANKIHNHKYQYKEDKFKGSKSKIDIFCPTHGWFEQNINNHLKGYGCSKCSGITKWTAETFFAKCREVHNNKFHYPVQTYRNQRQQITYICPIHGETKTTAQVHLSGGGCQKCSAINSFGFSRTDFISSCEGNNRKPLVYVIKCYTKNLDEVFYKIGITGEGIERRFKKTVWNYEYDVLFEIFGSPSYVFDLEKTLHRLMSDYRYIPRIQFQGYSECFSYIPKSVIKLLKDLGNTPQLQLIA